MLTAYSVTNGVLTPLSRIDNQDWFEKAIWIDLVQPTVTEIETVEKLSGLPIPNIEETEELEASSHYEVYANGFQLNCLFLQKSENSYANINVAFFSSGNRLITLCVQEIYAIRLLQKQWQISAESIRDPISIIIAILELKIDRLADLSEFGHKAIENISHKIFEKSNSDGEQIIDQLSRQDDLNGKMRLCLMDGQRDLNFIIRRKGLSDSNLTKSNDMSEDIRTLLTHNTFLSERIDFLLSATLGFINIEQNKIIKIFSISAVVLMPPTVIASIYGMNFQYMPELSWLGGYPFSILLMILAGVSPYLYFKRRGWL